MHKRIISLLLALIMCFSFLSLSAFADTEFTVTVGSVDTTGKESIANVSGGGVYQSGATVTVTANQVVGYTFLGWYIGDTQKSTNLSYSFVVDADTNIVAKYQSTGATAQLVISSKGEFTVSNGVTTTDPQDGSYKDSFDIGTTITVEYVDDEELFKYWSDKNGKIVSKSKTYTFTLLGETALDAIEANAKKDRALVVFMTEYEQILSARSYMASSTINFPSDPYRPGMRFTEWDKDEAAISAAIASGEDYIEVKPVFVPDGQFTVKVYRNDTLVETKTVKSGEVAAFAAPETFEGENFSYWARDGKIISYSRMCSFFANEDTSVIAVYGADSDTSGVVVNLTGTLENVSVTGEQTTGKAVFTSDRALSSGYTVVSQGIIVVTSKYYNSPAEADAALVLNGANVTKSESNKTTNNGEFIYTPKITGTTATPKTYYAKAYVNYTEEGSDTVQTIYSNLAIVRCPKQSFTEYVEELENAGQASFEAQTRESITTVDAGEAVPEVIYKYSLDDPYASITEYADYEMDFVISVDKATAKGDIILYGQYDAHNSNWVPIVLPDMTADTGYRLIKSTSEALESEGNGDSDLNLGEFKITYKLLAEYIRDFRCGAAYVGSEEDLDIVLSVDLVAYPADEEPIVVNHKTFTFQKKAAELKEYIENELPTLPDPNSTDEGKYIGDIVGVDDEGNARNNITKLIGDWTPDIGDDKFEPNAADVTNYYMGVHTVGTGEDAELILDSGREYKVNDSTSETSVYAHWNIDYEVSFNKSAGIKDIGDGKTIPEVLLLGKYGEYPWITYPLGTVEAGETIRLLDSVGINICYNTLVVDVKDFCCGALYCGDQEMVITVDLVGYETYDGVETGRKVVIDHYVYPFTEYVPFETYIAAQNTSDPTSDIYFGDVIDNDDVIITGDFDDLNDLETLLETKGFGDLNLANARGIDYNSVTGVIKVEDAREYKVKDDETIYDNVLVDFRVKFDKAISDGEVYLLGHYDPTSLIGGFGYNGWVPLAIPAMTEEEAAAGVLLMRDIHNYDGVVNYKFLKETVKDFICGAIYTGESELTITVELISYEAGTLAHASVIDTFTKTFARLPDLDDFQTYVDEISTSDYNEYKNDPDVTAYFGDVVDDEGNKTEPQIATGESGSDIDALKGMLDLQFGTGAGENLLTYKGIEVDEVNGTVSLESGHSYKVNDPDYKNSGFAGFKIDFRVKFNKFGEDELGDEDTLITDGEVVLIGHFDDELLGGFGFNGWVPVPVGSLTKKAAHEGILLMKDYRSTLIDYEFLNEYVKDFICGALYNGDKDLTITVELICYKIDNDNNVTDSRVLDTFVYPFYVNSNANTEPTTDGGVGIVINNPDTPYVDAEITAPVGTVEGEHELTFVVTPVADPTPVVGNEVIDGENVTVTVDEKEYEIKLVDENNDPVAAAEGKTFTVKLYVGTGFDAVVVKHKGVEIDAEYDAETGYVTFETDSFSPFTFLCKIIEKLLVNYTAPEAKEDLVYTGEAQELVTAGTVETAGCKMLYALNGGEYTENVPTAANAGSYTVSYMVKADLYHIGVAPKTMTVTIAKADAVAPAYEYPENLDKFVVNQGTTLGDIELAEGWAWANSATELNTLGTDVYTARYNPDSANYNDAEAALTVEVVKLVPEASFDTKFVNYTTYLYRVGNNGAVKLDSLFATTDAPDSDKVSVTVTNVAGNANGTFTQNSDNWKNSSISFTGTGVVNVELVYNGEQKFELKLEVINAANVTTYSELKNANSVMLNDIEMSSGSRYYISNATLYGNGFTFDISNGTNQGYYASGTYLILMSNAKLDNVVITGAVYKTLASESGKPGSESTNYNAAVIMNNGDCEIENCYISNCASPIRIISGNASIINSTIKGGTYANVDIRGGKTVMKNVTTINQGDLNDDSSIIGFGIVFFYEGVNSEATLTVDGLTQYNWISQTQANAMKNTMTKAVGQEMFKTGYSKYQYSDGSTKWVNTGIVSCISTVGAANINVTNPSLTYSGATASLSGSTGYVYAPNASAPQTTGAYESTAQGYVLPALTWNYPTEADCKYANGAVEISFDEGSTFVFDPNILTAVKNGESIKAYVTLNGADYTDKSYTFDSKGSYTFTYTITDPYVYDKDGNVADPVVLTRTLDVNTTLIKNIAAPTFKLGGETATAVLGTDGDYYLTISGGACSRTAGGVSIKYPRVSILFANNTYSSVSAITGDVSGGTKAAAFPVYDGVIEITDNGTTYGASTTSMEDTANETSLTLVGDPAKLFIYASANDAPSTPKVISKKLYYCSTALNGVERPSGDKATVEYIYTAKNGQKYHYFVTYNQPYNWKKSSGCVAEGTLITLADGTQKAVENITSADMLLAWDFFNGEYVAAPVGMNVYHATEEVDVVNLTFSNGTTSRIILSHGFFDLDELRFVYLDKENAFDYVGHRFATADNNAPVTLESVEITNEVVGIYSVASAFHYNAVVDGMLTNTPATYNDKIDWEFFNYYFQINEDMRYDPEQLASDIETYGLYTNEEFISLCPDVIAEVFTQEMFDVLNIQYFKIPVSKGQMTFDDLVDAIIEQIIYGDVEVGEANRIALINYLIYRADIL